MHHNEPQSEPLDLQACVEYALCFLAFSVFVLVIVISYKQADEQIEQELQCARIRAGVTPDVNNRYERDCVKTPQSSQ